MAERKDSRARKGRRVSARAEAARRVAPELLEVVRDYVHRLDCISDPEVLRLRGEDVYAFEERCDRARAALARAETLCAGCAGEGRS